MYNLKNVVEFEFQYVKHSLQVATQIGQYFFEFCMSTIIMVKSLRILKIRRFVHTLYIQQGIYMGGAYLSSGQSLPRKNFSAGV